jgi:hypothetical protein
MDASARVTHNRFHRSQPDANTIDVRAALKILEHKARDVDVCVV